MRIVNRLLKVVFYVTTFFFGLKIFEWISNAEKAFVITVQSEAMRGAINVGYSIFIVSVIVLIIWYLNDWKEETDVEDQISEKTRPGGRYGKKENLTFKKEVADEINERLIRLEERHKALKMLVLSFVAMLLITLVTELIKR